MRRRSWTPHPGGQTSRPRPPSPPPNHLAMVPSPSPGLLMTDLRTPLKEEPKTYEGCLTALRQVPCLISMYLSVSKIALKRRTRLLISLSMKEHASRVESESLLCDGFRFEAEVCQPYFPTLLCTHASTEKVQDAKSNLSTCNLTTFCIHTPFYSVTWCTSA